MQKTKRSLKGFTLIELLIVIAVIAILAAIAIPNLLSSRKAANESSAISTTRTLVSAQETFRSRTGAYAADLTALNTAELIDDTLAGGEKSGYDFTCGAVTGSEKTSYTVTAQPVDDNSGTRSFYADQTGVIRSVTGIGDASAGDPIE